MIEKYSFENGEIYERPEYIRYEIERKIRNGEYYIPSIPLEEARELFFLEHGSKSENQEEKVVEFSKQHDNVMKRLIKFFIGKPKKLDTNKEQETSKDENRRKVIQKLSKQYIAEHTKCLNEVFRQYYRKTIIYKEKQNITVYSKLPLSDMQVYAISQSYKNTRAYRTREDFVWYFERYYSEFDDIRSIKNRISLYDYIDDYLLIILDVNPEELGFDPTVIKMTKLFNVKKDNGQYQTIIKAYIDFDIIVNSRKPISIDEVISISKAFTKANSFIWEGEDGATCSEFVSALKDTGCSKNIKSYKYNNGLTIEFE
ncbi:MAG: hypothetical protein HFJ41_05860 [Clostridia bacterium]|nr:hypothetical protein [Clostridia bacterium]